MRSNHPNKDIMERAFHVTCEEREEDEYYHGKSFNGKILLRHDNLDLPLRTKKPTVFAVWNDLFHEDVPDEFIDRAYAVMALCPQHVFLILTKRPERMARYWNDTRIGTFIDSNVMIADAAEEFYGNDDVDFVDESDHIYHGTTICNQPEADKNIVEMLKVPGKRFLSIEPMLGPIDLFKSMPAGDEHHCEWCGGFIGDPHDCYDPQCGIHQLLLGGESGKNARPMHPDWVSGIERQCREAGVSFYFKQWGEWAAVPKSRVRWPDKIEYIGVDGKPIPPLHVFDPIKGDVIVGRYGKKKAGRSLYGQTHDDLIWI